MDKIELKKMGNAFVPINIKPISDTTMRPIDFKVDTGADVTTISKEDLRDFGYDLDWIVLNAVIFDHADKPTTASGEKVNAGYVKLPLLNILGYEAKNWPFLIVMDEDHDFRNLLGRDLLVGFNFCFDFDNNHFTIEKTKTFIPRIPLQPTQEINEIKTSKLDER